MSAAAEAISNYWLTHATEATEKQDLFIQGLEQTGTVIHAAQFAGINRQTAYQWRNLFPEFKQRWDDTLENVTDNVERSLYNQAVSEKNVVATIFYLKNNRAKYRDRVTIDVVSTQREVEERLTELQAKLQGGEIGERVSSLQLSPAPASTKEIIAQAIGGVSIQRNDPRD